MCSKTTRTSRGERRARAARRRARRPASRGEMPETMLPPTNTAAPRIRAGMRRPVSVETRRATLEYEKAISVQVPRIASRQRRPGARGRGASRRTGWRSASKQDEEEERRAGRTSEHRHRDQQLAEQVVERGDGPHEVERAARGCAGPRRRARCRRTRRGAARGTRSAAHEEERHRRREQRVGAAARSRGR